MGLFGRIAHGVASGVRNIGRFGGAALSKIGSFKHVYDKVNNATDGIIGDTLERLPIVGPALAHAGAFLKNENKMQALSNGLRNAGGIADKIDKFGGG